MRNLIKLRTAQHKHYLKNKDKYKAAAKKSRPKTEYNRALWVQQLKSELACENCGETHPACLDFHHKDQNKKEFSIGIGIWNYSKERVLAEIKKCIILCKNCHCKLHWKDWLEIKRKRVTRRRG